MFAQIRSSISDVGGAVRRPEALAARFKETPGEAPPPALFVVLMANAALGLAAYGLTMQMHRGPEGMLEGALLAPTAAGLAWVIAFPALYIINRLLGSELNFSTTALAASITVSFGASAMLASVPINWFFTLALPFEFARLAVNLIVFAGVGVCMSDVFIRVMNRLEPGRSHGFAFMWLALLATIGAELFLLFGVFNFA
jgi:hypothetical protein